MAGETASSSGDDLGDNRSLGFASADSALVSYQPLVIVLLAVGAGIVADRYLQPTSQGSTLSYIACWLVGAASLAAWYLAWRKQYNHAAGWLLVASAALAGAAWHHVNWFDFSADELARYA